MTVGFNKRVATRGGGLKSANRGKFLLLPHCSERDVQLAMRNRHVITGTVSKRSNAANFFFAAQ